jgi:hypothetical protein
VLLSAWLTCSQALFFAPRYCCLQETRQQLESAQADNSRLVGQLTSLKQQLDQAAAAGPSTSSKQVQEVQAQAAQLVDKVSMAGLLQVV